VSVRIAALVLAAGSSQRFGGRPKQFEDLGGVTVLQRAVRIFAERDGIDEVWVVTSAALLDRTREVLADEGIAGVVLGGDLRADSTRLGLAALAPQITHVLVHDAARPLVPAAVVADCIAALAEADVVATVVEPRDSVLIVEGDELRTPERSTIRLHQTPQGFRRSVLAEAWERLDGEAPTDDVTAVLRAFPDATVALVPGHRHSLKITDADDLLAVRAFLGAAGE
jgi:2-C-methyl-D-erythritol 4-phosphate cytidylyltransferase